LGLSGLLKRFGCLCCGACSKSDRSIVSNGTTAPLLQPTAMILTAVGVTLHFPRENPPCDAASRPNSLTTCYTWHCHCSEVSNRVDFSSFARQCLSLPETSRVCCSVVANNVRSCDNRQQPLGASLDLGMTQQHGLRVLASTLAPPTSESNGAAWRAGTVN